MAIYHFSLKPIARKQKNAVAAVAYLTGTKLYNERNGDTYDYTRRSGVLHTEIVLPHYVQVRVERQALSNQAELAEKRIDARTANEYVLALPNEIDIHQNIELAKVFCSHLCDHYKIAIDFAIHAPSRQGDQRN